MNDIIFIAPQSLKLINDGRLKDFPFWSFLQSGAQTPKQLKKTQYYDHYLKLLKSGVHPNKINGIKNQKDIVNRLKYLLELNKKIKEDPEFDDIDKIQVFIDSIGHVRVFEGCHRAICALHNNIHKIPVEVMHRHIKWQAFKEKLEMEYLKDGMPDKRLYNPISHADFGSWVVMRENRFNIMLNFLQKNQDKLTTPELHTISGSYRYAYNWTPVHYFKEEQAERLMGLVLGCHFGFHCHEFVKHGAMMTGVEINPDYYKTAQYLNRVYDLSVDFRNDDMLEFLKKDGYKKYDFIICLSIFYAIYRNKERGRKLLQEMSKKTDLLFIDNHEEIEREVFLKEIQEHTDFKNIEMIHDGQYGRQIFAMMK